MTLKKTIDKVYTHASIKMKYVIGKLQYKYIPKHAENKSNRVGKSISPNYKLNVYLQRSLEEIDDLIKSNKELKTFILEEGERSFSNEWIILNSRQKGMYDLNSGHYRWTEDIFTNYVYQSCFYMDARHQVTDKGTDIKIPWEISRMQSLFSLALGYRASKDEKYVRKIIDIVRDFHECCPVGDGVNWNVSMEVGIRISNIILACELIQDSALFDENFKRLLVIIIYEHMNHIRRNLENEKDGGNHLLADILGLAGTSAAMPFLPGAIECSAYAQKMISQELMRQVLPDGAHFEGSVSYHRLVGEILSFSVIAQSKLGYSLTNNEKNRLHKMGQFSFDLRMPNGLVPQLGDNDSGRVFQLSTENTRDHDSFINLVSIVTDEKIVYPNRQDGYYVFAPVNTKVDNTVFSRPGGDICEYPYFKCIRVQNDNVFLTFSGMTPESFNKAGHAHNDLLSFCFAVGGEEFIVDPGSGEYTGNLDIRHALRSVNNHSTVSIDNLEQRRVPTDLAQAFQWNSTARCSIASIKEQNAIKLNGKCSYFLTFGNATHERTIDIYQNNKICIYDLVSDMSAVCSLSLPIFPGRIIEKVQDTVIIYGQEYTLQIRGSWQFSIMESLYAVQYKKIVPNRIVHGISNTKDNWIQIDIVTQK
ncbi:heparinase II/III family protein [Roseburia hominis]